MYHCDERTPFYFLLLLEVGRCCTAGPAGVAMELAEGVIRRGREAGDEVWLGFGV